MKDRIKKIRKELDLTQQEFADRIGIARGNIAAYEVGKMHQAILSYHLYVGNLASTKTG